MVPKKIDRPDPMRSDVSEISSRVHISVLTYQSRDELSRLPSNVTVGLAVPEVLPIDEWSRKAKAETAKAQREGGAERDPLAAREDPD